LVFLFVTRGRQVRHQTSPVSYEAAGRFAYRAAPVLTALVMVALMRPFTFLPTTAFFVALPALCLGAMYLYARLRGESLFPSEWRTGHRRRDQASIEAETRETW
jgi:hypothetical protein